MKRRTFSFVFLGSLVLYLAFAWIRGGSVELFSWSGPRLTTLLYGIAYYILTVVCLRKFREKLAPGWIVAAIVLGTILLEVPLWVLSPGTIAAGSWLELFVRLLAIGSGYLCWRLAGRGGRIVVSGLFLALVLGIAWWAYPLWNNKFEYGTWTGRVDSSRDVGSIGMQTSEDETVRLEQLRGRYVVLDFISSSCGICLRKLPLVQELADRYAFDSRVEVYAVFCRDTKRSETPRMGREMLAERGYTLPVLSIPMDDPDLKEVFGVDRFPVVQIIDPEGRIIYRGSIERAGDFLPER